MIRRHGLLRPLGREMEPDQPELARYKAVSHPLRQFLPILGPFRPRRVLAPEGSLWQEPAACSALLGRFLEYRACCRSSVVEHSIGNGEVDSSILSGSTIHLFGSIDFIRNSVLSATQECHTDQWFP